MSEILIAVCVVSVVWTIVSIVIGLGAAAFIYHVSGELDEDGEPKEEL